MLNKQLPTLLLILCLFSIFASLPVLAADFVGAKVCQGCHQKEYTAWQGSHHDMAMKHATDKSVLGNFNNSVLGQGKNKSLFFKQKDNFWVNIKGPDGKFNDYQIKYTFGYEPLQQYMVEFDDGRVQLIPFAWDSRSKEQGGQRWFNLYPDRTEKHQEFFGPIPAKIGITCVLIVIQPMLRKISMLRTTVTIPPLAK